MFENTKKLLDKLENHTFLYYFAICGVFFIKFYKFFVKKIFHNFGSTGSIFKIFTVLEMASKFVCSFSLAKECSMKKKGRMCRANQISRESILQGFFQLEMVFDFFISLIE